MTIDNEMMVMPSFHYVPNKLKLHKNILRSGQRLLFISICVVVMNANLKRESLIITNSCITQNF